MTERSFDSLMNYTGNRYRGKEEVQQLCESLDNLSCRDLLNILTAVSTVRAPDVPLKEVIEGNRFHTSSVVDQRDFYLIDGIIFDKLPGIKFVDLSPLQPFGLNTNLAQIGANNIISALRRSEVNADITTGLFRVAYIELVQNQNKGRVTIAGNARITRAPQFDPETKFLPHFRMFGEVTVGREDDINISETGPAEMEVLADHLNREVSIIDRVNIDRRFNMNGVKIEVGNVAFMRELIEKGLVDPLEVNKHTIDPAYDVFSRFNIDLPRTIPLESSAFFPTIEKAGFTRGLEALKVFYKTLDSKYPGLIPRIDFSLDRIAGAGYYKTICYKLSGYASLGALIPLADGGTTTWGQKFSGGNKRIFTVSSGMGIELLCQYFIRRQEKGSVESKVT